MRRIYLLYIFSVSTMKDLVDRRGLNHGVKAVRPYDEACGVCFIQAVSVLNTLVGAQSVKDRMLASRICVASHPMPPTHM